MLHAPVCMYVHVYIVQAVAQISVPVQTHSPDRCSSAEFPGRTSPRSLALSDGPAGAEVSCLCYCTRLQDGADVPLRPLPGAYKLPGCIYMYIHM